MLGRRRERRLWKRRETVRERGRWRWGERLLERRKEKWKRASEERQKVEELRGEELRRGIWWRGRGGWCLLNEWLNELILHCGIVPPLKNVFYKDNDDDVNSDADDEEEEGMWWKKGRIIYCTIWTIDTNRPQFRCHRWSAWRRRVGFRPTCTCGSSVRPRRSSKQTTERVF